MIRKATGEDLEALYDLRTEAEQWLSLKGIKQWTPEWQDRARELMASRVHKGKTWISEDVDGLRWTLSLDEPDLDFWKDEDDLESALYLYKLIVARRCKGAGSEAIEWATNEARNKAKQWLRIDFVLTSEGLAKYYFDNGFEEVRREHVDGRLSGWLMQRSTQAKLVTDSVKES